MKIKKKNNNNKKFTIIKNFTGFLELVFYSNYFIPVGIMNGLKNITDVTIRLEYFPIYPIKFALLSSFFITLKRANFNNKSVFITFLFLISLYSKIYEKSHSF